MDTAIAEQHGVESRQHRGPHLQRREQTSYARAMTADEVVLQGFAVGIVDSILCHGAEAGIDAIDELILRESFEEIIAFLEFGGSFFGDGNRVLFYDNLVEAIKRKRAFAEGDL